MNIKSLLNGDSYERKTVLEASNDIRIRIHKARALT